MKNLCTLVLFQCSGLLCTFVDPLNPNTYPSKEVVCPSLEQLVLVLRIWRNVEEDEFDMGTVIEMAVARASRGVRLGTVKNRAKLDLADVMELRKQVLQMEYGPEVDVYGEKD